MTREEAMKIVRNTYHTDTEKEALEILIPELRESEDERIRKIIIKHFEEIANRNEQSWINLDIPYILAYLEKQKEHTWSPSEDEMGVLYKLCYISNQISDEDDTNLTRLYQDLKREYFNGHSFENMFPKEKQKEQKPKSAEAEALKINKNIWHVCTRDVFIDEKPVYLKGDIVNSDDFLLVLDTPTAKAAFHRVWFPNNDEEKFCDAILHRNPDKQ